MFRESQQCCVPFLHIPTKESRKHTVSFKKKKRKKQLLQIVSLLCTTTHIHTLCGFKGVPMDKFIQDERTRMWTLNFLERERRGGKKKSFALGLSLFIQPPVPLKPSAAGEHEVSGVQGRCLHTLSSPRRVFGKGGAATVYKACLQFCSSNNGCVHSPIQGRENATQRDKNIKHWAIWGRKSAK